MTEAFEKRLDRFEEKMDKIAAAVSAIAVQENRLNTLERESTILFAKMDEVEKFQASCPRGGISGQLKALWLFVAAIVLSIIGTFFKGS